MTALFSNKIDEKRNKIVQYFYLIIKEKVISRKIEQSIYNYIIEISKEKNIQRRWANRVFLKLYNSKIISIYSNLKKSGLSLP